MAEVLLGLGANLGEPARTIDAALARLPAAGVTVTVRSSFYRTPPWGVTDQPDFINLCARAVTALSPRALLAALQSIEAGLGRVRDRPWGPRLIDIDILAYDDLVVAEPGLTIPHPRLTERAFVLIPLAEIAPEVMVAGQRIASLAETCDRTGIERFAR